MSQTYVVKSGDTLGAIASKYQVKGGYQALAQYNGISNPNLISVGQTIILPETSSSSTTNSGNVTSGSTGQSITEGSKVKITGNLYATGQTIPNWVKQREYTVSRLSGSKALIKEIVSWVYITDLQLIAASAPKQEEPKKEEPKKEEPKKEEPKKEEPKKEEPKKEESSSTPEQTYIVKSGDTLSKIANKFNVAGGHLALAAYNGISNPNMIRVGQVIKIPGTSGTTQTQTPSENISSGVTNKGVCNGGYPNIGTANIQPIYNFVKNNCYSGHPYAKAIACGFLGNIYTESHYQPDAEQVENSRTAGGKGICQWDDRKYNLFNYCGATYEQKDKWIDLDKQLNFLKYELDGSESGAHKYIKNNTPSNDEAGARQAAYIIAKKFERCAVPENIERQDKAAENFRNLS